MADFYLGQGDLGPVMEGIAILPNGEPADLSGATLELFMAPYGALLPATGTPVIITDGPAGAWQHEWVTGESDVAGTFCFQLRGTLQDGKPYTFPTERAYYTVEIWPKV